MKKFADPNQQIYLQTLKTDQSSRLFYRELYEELCAQKATWQE